VARAAIRRYSSQMRWIFDKLAGFLSVLCRIFDVVPENMDDGRPGNLPPPSGGISSLEPR